jgi:hypothetical protein
MIHDTLQGLQTEQLRLNVPDSSLKSHLTFSVDTCHIRTHPALHLEAIVDVSRPESQSWVTTAVLSGRRS